MITEEIPRFGSLFTCPNTHPTMTALSPPPPPVPSLTSLGGGGGFLSSPTHARRPDSVLCWSELGMSRVTPAAP